MVYQSYIFPSKKQRVEFEEAKIKENPQTKEEANNNKQIQERIKEIERVF